MKTNRYFEFQIRSFLKLQILGNIVIVKKNLMGILLKSVKLAKGSVILELNAWS